MTARKLDLRREFTGDASLDRAQALAQRAAQRVNSLVGGISDGVLVPNVTISTNGTTVAHKLGRVPVGYIITRIRSISSAGAYIVGDGTGQNSSTSLNLIARTNVAGTQSITVDLWVFG